MTEKQDTDWTIRPLVGIGKLRFGMTPSQVADILGSNVKFTRLIEDGSTNEIRQGGNAPVCNYRDGRLRCIDIYSTSYNVCLDSILLFQEDPYFVIEHLECVSGPPAVVFGICYFKNIGVSLGKWINPPAVDIGVAKSETVGRAARSGGGRQMIAEVGQPLRSTTARLT